MFLDPFVFGDGTLLYDLTRKQALVVHGDIVSRIPGIVASLSRTLMDDSVVLGTSPRSDAEAAGEWLAARSRLVEVERPADPGPYWSDRPDISVPTKSACCLVGLFFGECLRSQLPEAEWKLDTSDQRHMYYHHTVLQIAGSTEMLEPFSIVMNFVRGRLLRADPRTLGSLFDIWVELLSGKGYPSP
mgnify:CR=1 FL=1